jgi:hypothetical protein
MCCAIVAEQDCQFVPAAGQISIVSDCRKHHGLRIYAKYFGSGVCGLADFHHEIEPSSNASLKKSFCSPIRSD